MVLGHYKVEGNKLAAVPIRIANNERQDGQRLYKRFFLIDAVSSRKSSNSAPTHIRYAKSITIRYELLPEQSNGFIYPPVMLVEYAAIETEEEGLTFDMALFVAYSRDG